VTHDQIPGTIHPIGDFQLGMKTVTDGKTLIIMDMGFTFPKTGCGDGSSLAPGVHCFFMAERDPAD
jgi:hypothetical protein